MRSGIIAGGNWIIDHIKDVDVWPPEDGLANILSQTSGNGGGPYNVLKDLAKLGAPFPLGGIGLIGDDADGRRILEDCRVHRIDTAHLRVTSAAPTSYTDVMSVRGTGHRTYFHARGTNALLGVDHFDFRMRTAKYFHLGYLLLLDGLDAPAPDGRPRAIDVLHRARQSGLKTSLDCVTAAPERQRTVVTPVLPEVDILFVNDHEAEALTGIVFGRGSAVDHVAAQRTARALLTLGVREWVVLHFPEGAYACSVHGELVWQPSVQVPESAIAGTAGAGDAFAAGILFGLHENWPMNRALELGVCAAAASLRHPTTSESVVSAADCIELGKKHGFRAIGQ